MKRTLLAALLIIGVLVTAVAALAFQRRQCPSTMPTRLIVHERGRITDEQDFPQNVREGPGTRYDPPIGQIPVGGIFYVLDGPECSPRYAWFQVEYRDENGELLVGWIAEGADDVYFAETYPPGE